MPPKSDAPVPAIQHSEDGRFVSYGFEVNGVFHPFAGERLGDYEEREKAAKDESSK